MDCKFKKTPAVVHSPTIKSLPPGVPEVISLSLCPTSRILPLPFIIKSDQELVSWTSFVHSNTPELLILDKVARSRLFPITYWSPLISIDLLNPLELPFPDSKVKCVTPL